MFARKRSDVGPIPELDEQLGPASNPKNPWAERALAMFGISMDELQQKGVEIRAILDDYRDRLQRVETKLDLVSADLAELIEQIRLDRK